MQDTPRLTFFQALPFWSSLTLPLLVFAAAYVGGWCILLVPVYAWYLTSALDALLGKSNANIDPNTGENALFWHNLVLWLWTPVQLFTQLGVLAYVTSTTHLNAAEMIGVFLCLGIMAGGIGIVYAHELMHRRSRWERWLADILLASVYYGHFRSEHLLVHHRYVGTPRDPVTARYNEGFHRFFFRVLPECLKSAWGAEKAQRLRAGMPWWHHTNPFWRYAALQALITLIALGIGGWAGLALILFQALVAVWQLELVNYVEHYGLTRKHLGEGRYENTQPHHSWNATHTATNWLLINLQRHSDHHSQPARPFPLLQAHEDENVPQLPLGYPLMTMAAMVPPLWRRVMNPKVRAWRRLHYPEISDWSAYSRAELPLPR